MDWNLRLHSKQHICVKFANSDTESVGSRLSAFSSWRLVAHFSSWAAGFLATATDSTFRFFFCWCEVGGDSRFRESSVVGFVTRTGSVHEFAC